MVPAEHYEVLVVGSGEAGKYLAWHTARAGRHTAVVERELIGGACPNTNCLPSKNEIWSAKVAELVRRADRFGSAADPGPADMRRVLERKRAMVEGLVALHLDLFAASGAELIMGRARCTAPRTVAVALNDGGERLLTADRLVLNLGSHAAIPAVPGLAEAAPLTNVGLLELDTLPDHLVVLGGGYVGLEFAQSFRRFGSAVTVVEAGPRLAGREDPEVSGALHDLLADEGVAVELGTAPARIEGRSGHGVTVRLGGPDGERAIEGSHILVAAGRVPNTAGIGLERAGVAVDGQNRIVVNDRLETSAAATWAVGDCAGSPQFTHAGFDDFRIIRDNWNGGARSARDRLVPYCMYTDPPLARIGLSPGDAARLGRTVRVATLPVASVLRARTLGEPRGFMQAVVDANGDEILGFTMFGPEAGEVLAAVQATMLAGAPYTLLRDAILTHPTMAEGLNPLLARVPAR